MSIFSRLFKIGQASANQAIDKLEKPELMLEQAIKDKEKQIREAKQSIQSCIATERQTKAQLEKEKAEKFNWEQKAEAAMLIGREDLAVKALERSAEHEQRMTSLEPNWQSQKQSVDELKQEIITMENEIAEFKRNKDFIIAQSKAASVKTTIPTISWPASKLKPSARDSKRMQLRNSPKPLIQPASKTSSRKSAAAPQTRQSKTSSPRSRRK